MDDLIVSMNVFTTMIYAMADVINLIIMMYALTVLLTLAVAVTYEGKIGYRYKC